MSSYSSDEKCRALLEKLRWPKGIECPRCKGTKITRLDGKVLLCLPCEYHFTGTVGTLFADTHLPLEKWFLAALLLCEAKKGMSACQIQRTIGVSYKTAWYLCHRIREAMIQAQSPTLWGTVEVDETYVGGVEKGGKRGRGSNKQIVIGLRQRGGELRLFHVQDVKSGTLERYIKDNISGAVDVIITDDSSTYPKAIEADPLFGDFRGKHQTINHSSGLYVRGTIHTNTIENSFSLLKRGMFGTWHHVSAKHLWRYLTEMMFRFNRRNHSDLWLDTIRSLVSAPSLKFAELVSSK